MTLLVEHAHIRSNDDPNPNLTTNIQDTRNVQAIVLLSPKIDKFVI